MVVLGNRGATAPHIGSAVLSQLRVTTEKEPRQFSQSDATGVVLNGRIRIVGWFGNLLLEAVNQPILVGEPRRHHALKRLPFPLLGHAPCVERQQLTFGTRERRLCVVDPH